MYLKKLYFYDKKIFFLFIIYFVSFLYINFKSGLIVSPIMQYGMYSSMTKISDTISINRVYVNDTILDFSQLSMADRDVIDVSLDNFYSEKINNRNVYTTIKRVTKADKIMQEKVYLNSITDQVFYNWYQTLLENILNRKIDNIKILKQKYVWKNDVFFEVNK